MASPDVHEQRKKPILAEPSLPREESVAQQWWSLPPNTVLPLLDGSTCRLLYPGLRGGPAGPDVRDAILIFQEDAVQRVGAVEFHVRVSDWYAHGHHTDPRYNSVLLHIVLLHDDPKPTRCQNGQMVPTCSLYDIPIAENGWLDGQRQDRWPCHEVVRDLSEEERDVLLHRAGLLRFEQKTHVFVEQLHDFAHAGYDTIERYGECLVIALAEGLAYGRDRAFFRASALHLLGRWAIIPEPLGHAGAPSPLDRQRLRIVPKLIERKQEIWQRLRSTLVELHDETTILSTLQAYFCTLGLGLARTDILLCNVVFPFAAAVALLEHDSMLGRRAQRLYEMHPGLSSNAITRMMSAQLQLAEEPHGSCRQQGLHYIYQQTCQAKHCAECIMGRRIV